MSENEKPALNKQVNAPSADSKHVSILSPLTKTADYIAEPLKNMHVGEKINAAAYTVFKEAETTLESLPGIITEAALRTPVVLDTTRQNILEVVSNLHPLPSVPTNKKTRER